MTVSILQLIAIVLYIVSVAWAIYFREASAIYFAVLSAVTLFVWTGIIP